MPPLDRWTIVAPLRPRFRDTDAMCHINNAVYVTYLEVARQEYWRAFKHDDNYRVVLGDAHFFDGEAPLFLRRADRRQHLFVVGKTGSGKSLKNIGWSAICLMGKI